MMKLSDSETIRASSQNPSAQDRHETADQHRVEPEVHQLIAVAAYYRAECRNFEPGHELEDWLDVEAEIEAQRKSMKGFPA